MMTTLTEFINSDFNDKELLIAATKLADLAAAISCKYFRSNLNIELKEGHYPVTKVDQEIELCLRDWIKTNYPEHNIIGEEFSNQNAGTSRYTWVIDPIDGTVSYITGKPLFTTLIALLKDGQPIIGIIDQPILNDRFIGVKGGGSWLNGNQIYTNKACTQLQEARLNATTPYMFKSKIEQDTFNHLHKQVRVTSFGGDAYAYGLLASGCIDIILEADLKYYDIAALIPVVTESGGVITDWQGKALTLDFNGQCLVSGNPDLYKIVFDAINKD